MRIKSICLFGLLALTLLAFGCNGKTAPSVAVVNTDKVYKESEPGKAGIAYLDGISTNLQSELADLQKKAETASNKKTAQADFQQALMGLQQRFSAEQQQVITTLNKTYQSALMACREKFGYAVIFGNDTALSYAPDADITQKVIEEMNAKPVSFTRLKPEEVEAQAGTQQ